MTAHAAKVDAELAQSPEGRVAPTDTRPRYIPIGKWDNYFDWPPLGGLRHLRFHCETNGFREAFKKVGARVLVDADAFWRIVNEQGAR